MLPKPVDFPRLLAPVEEVLGQPLVMVVDDDHDLCPNLWDLLSASAAIAWPLPTTRSAAARRQRLGPQPGVPGNSGDGSRRSAGSDQPCCPRSKTQNHLQQLYSEVRNYAAPLRLEGGCIPCGPSGAMP